MKTYCICIFLFWFQICSTLANELPHLYFEHINTSDGLSQNYITSIHEDAQGFIWIGTKNGLNKYDGYRVIEYLHSSKDSNSLYSSYIEVIYKDSHGKLWIGTNKGLCVYREESDDFERIKISSSPNDSAANRYVLSIYEDKDTLWVGMAGGMLYAIDLANEKPIKSYPPTLDKMVIKEIIRNKDLLLIGCPNNGVLISKMLSHSEMSYEPVLSSSSEKLSVSSFLLDKQGDLWIGTNNKGLVKYGDSQSIPSNKIILDLCFYNDSTILVGTEGGGLICYNHFNNSIQTIDTNLRNINLNSDVITCFYIDSSKTLWVGTTNGGVNKYDPYKNNFRHVSLLNENDSRVAMQSVYAMQSLSPNTMLIGLDAKGAHIFHQDTGLMEKNSIPSLSETSINSILKDSRNLIWLGTHIKSLKLVGSPAETKAIEKQIEKYLSKTSSIKAIIEDHKHRIWIGTSVEGIICYDSDSKTMKSYLDDFNIYLSPNLITNIYEDDEQQLWVGTTNGLFRYSENEDRFELFFFPNKSDPLSSYNAILPICKIGDMLWLGTRQGLIKFSYKEGVTQTFDREDGLQSESIKGLLHDSSRGDLWISTEKGLSKINIQTQEITNFGFKNGVFGSEFNDMSFLKGENGYFYFGSVDGIYYFHPALIQTNPNPPKIAITNYRLYNHKLPNKGIEAMSIIPVSQDQTIEIPYRESVFSIDYVALNYTNSHKNQYAYKLEGYDTNWKYVREQRMATYTNISPGTYIFKVIAANNDGVWNTEGSSLKIIIIPPWWGTPWAYVFYMLSIAGIIFMSVRFYMARLKMKNQLANEQFERMQLEKLNQMKTQFFSNITHELRTPLTLIISPIERLMTNRTYVASQHEYVKIIYNNAIRLLGLVNQLLDFTKTDFGNIQFTPTVVDIVAFARDKVESFLPLAEEKNINLHFSSDGGTYLNCLADPVIVSKILYNLLSNAIKYTLENGEVHVVLAVERKDEESNILLIVKDTGKGIPFEKQVLIFDRFYQLEEDISDGTGIGLSLVKSFVELHKGKIKVESDLGKGSSFIVSIPFVPMNEPVSITEAAAIQKPISHLYDESNEHEKCDSEKRIKILVAEDNKELREFISSILSDRYTVLEANNGLVALELAKKEIPDLILSDVLMPEMNGYQLCEQVKQYIQTCHIPFIMLTALTSEANQIEGLTVGADDYIPKPFSSDILLSKIKNMLSNRSLMHRRLAALSALEPDEVIVEDRDSVFLLDVIQYIKSNLSNIDLKVEDISKEVGMSRTPFFKKIKALTRLTPNDLIREIRLNKAAKLLSDSDLTIGEIAYMVGFSSPKYFRECFKKQFGRSPSEYMEGLGK